MIVSPNAGNNPPFLMVGRLRFGSFRTMPGSRKCHIFHDVFEAAVRFGPEKSGRADTGTVVTFCSGPHQTVKDNVHL
jgi:hypothetical protein